MTGGLEEREALISWQQMGLHRGFNYVRRIRVTEEKPNNSN